MNRAALGVLKERWDRVRQEWRTGDGILALEHAHGMLDLLDALLEEEADVVASQDDFRWGPKSPGSYDWTCSLCGFELTNVAMRTMRELVDHEASCPRDPRNRRRRHPFANWSA